MNWERKWNAFKDKEDIQTEVEQDEQLEAEHRKVFDWIKSHEKEVKGLIKSDEQSGSYPHDVIQSYEFEAEIEGHPVYWYCEFITDRDGEEYESYNNEFLIDGKKPNTRTSQKIDDYLIDLCQYFV